MKGSSRDDDLLLSLPETPLLPLNIDRRSFLMRNVAIGAAAAMTGTVWTPEARAQQAAKEAAAPPLGATLSPDLDIVRQAGPVNDGGGRVLLEASRRPRHDHQDSRRYRPGHVHEVQGDERGGARSEPCPLLKRNRVATNLATTRYGVVAEPRSVGPKSTFFLTSSECGTECDLRRCLPSVTLDRVEPAASPGMFAIP